MSRGRWDRYEAAVLADRRLEALLAEGWRSALKVALGPLLAVGIMLLAQGPDLAWRCMAWAVYGTGMWMACGEVVAERERWARERALGVLASSQVMGALRAMGLLGVVSTAGFVTVVQLMGSPGPPVGWLALTLLATLLCGLGSGLLVGVWVRRARMAWAAVAGVLAAQALLLVWADANWGVPAVGAYATLEAFGGEAVEVFAGAGRLAVVALEGAAGVLMSAWLLARRRW